MTIAVLTVSGILDGVLWWSMIKTNKKRRAGKEDGKIQGLTEENIDELGDESPRFIYAT